MKKKFEKSLKTQGYIYKNMYFQPLVLIKTRYVDNGFGYGFAFKLELDALQELYPHKFDYIKQEDLKLIYRGHFKRNEDGLTVRSNAQFDAHEMDIYLNKIEISVFNLSLMYNLHNTLSHKIFLIISQRSFTLIIRTIL